MQFVLGEKERRASNCAKLRKFINTCKKNPYFDKSLPMWLK